MNTKTVIETNLEEYLGYDWLSYDKDGEAVLVNDQESIVAAAKAWKISPEAVEAMKKALDFLSSTIIETAIEDLKDIWEVVNGDAED